MNGLGREVGEIEGKMQTTSEKPFLFQGRGPRLRLLNLTNLAWLTTKVFLDTKVFPYL